MLELIDFPSGTQGATGPVSRYQRLALPCAATPSGELRVPHQAPDSGWRLVLEHETPRFVGDAAARLTALDSTSTAVFQVQMGADTILFRVVEPATPALRWPLELDALASPAPTNADALEVLADALLERGHPLGARLRGLDGADSAWLGELPLLVAAAKLDLSLSRGLATGLVVRGLAGLDRFGAHVVTHLARRVELIAWSDESLTAEGATAALDQLLAHGLPWLAELHVHGLREKVGHALKKAWRAGRWSGRVSPACSLETPPPARLVLRSGARADEVPERGFMQVGDGPPLCFVRLRQGLPELTVTREAFLLNSEVRRRGPGQAGPWVTPLRPGDRFEIDGRAAIIDVA
jgi:hypothetical protein